MNHELKCWPAHFQATVDRLKRADVRWDDRKFRVGDGLRLREWDPEKALYTGRALIATVSHILDWKDGPWLTPGYVILSLRDLTHLPPDLPSPT